MSRRGSRSLRSALLLGSTLLALVSFTAAPAGARPAKRSALVGRYVGTFTPDSGLAAGDFELTINTDRSGDGMRSILGRGRFGKLWQQLLGTYCSTPEHEAFTCVLHRGSRNVVVSLNLSFDPGAKTGMGDYLITRDHVLLEHGTISVTRP